MKKEDTFYKVLSVVLFLICAILLLFLAYQVTIQNSKMEKSIVLVETNQGNFKIKLYLKESPITAGNFKSLVESGFYDNTKFHRIIKNFMVQGGDPLSKNDSLKNRWGTGGGEVIKDEFIKGLSNTRGTIAMANSGPNSGSSQFFINIVNNTYLDWDKQPYTSKHPVFGEIIEGMDVVDKISNMNTSRNDQPASDVIILRATMVDK